jgi:hypothetical protein
VKIKLNFISGCLSSSPSRKHAIIISPSYCIPPTDMALIKNNAKVAAQIAVELSKLQRDIPKSPTNENEGKVEKVKNKPTVIGGSILDIHYRVEEDSLEVS